MTMEFVKIPALPLYPSMLLEFVANVIWAKSLSVAYVVLKAMSMIMVSVKIPALMKGLMKLQEFVANVN